MNVCRLYVGHIIYINNTDKDPMERGVINLATAQTEYSEVFFMFVGCT